MGVPRRPLRRIVLVASVLCTCVVLHYLFCHTRQQFWLSFSTDDKGRPETVANPTNSTLGFGYIYVVSKQDSPRRTSLIHSANVTDVQLTIPAQPIWATEDQLSFKSQDSTIGNGSMLAWLGHLYALRQYA